MQNAVINTVEVLKAFLSSLPPGTLFRGQTGHYPGEDGAPNILNSHYRNGCVPATLRKWGFYAQEVLTHLTGGVTPELDLVQALLQHYGWRSFYVDLSSRAEVACWFASHRYGEQRALEMGRDYNHDSVFLEHRDAKYEPHEGNGNLYCIDSTFTLPAEARFIDLCDELKSDFTARFHKQAGWLAGSLSEPLPPECITWHISAPASVLRSFANQHGLVSTEDLFPQASEDTILSMFESVPWRRATMLGGRTPLFERDLSLPDYHVKPHKPYGPEVAFPDPGPIEELPPGAPVMPCYLIPAEGFFARPNMPASGLRFVADLLRTHKEFRVETDQLIRLPEHCKTPEYCKGIIVSSDDDDRELVTVSAFKVVHPGRELEGIYCDRGWYYRVAESGVFSRVEHPNQCNCTRPWRHEQLLTVLVAFDWLLEHRPQRKVSNLLTVFDDDGDGEQLIQLNPKRRPLNPA